MLGAQRVFFAHRRRLEEGDVCEEGVQCTRVVVKGVCWVRRGGSVHTGATRWREMCAETTPGAHEGHQGREDQ